MIMPSGSLMALLLIVIGVVCLLWADITSETPISPPSWRSSSRRKQVTVSAGAAVAFMVALTIIWVFGLGNSASDVLTTTTSAVTNNYYGSVPETSLTLPAFTALPESRNREASIRITNDSPYPVSVRNIIVVTSASDGKSFLNQDVQYGALWLGTVSETKTIPGAISDNLSIVEYGNPLWNLPRFMTLLDTQCFNFMAAEHYLQNGRTFFSLGCHTKWGFGNEKTSRSYEIVVTLVATSIVNPVLSTTLSMRYTVQYDQFIRGPVLVVHGE